MKKKKKEEKEGGKGGKMAPPSEPVEAQLTEARRDRAAPTRLRALLENIPSENRE